MTSIRTVVAIVVLLYPVLSASIPVVSGPSIVLGVTKNLSENTSRSADAHLRSSGQDVYVVWNDGEWVDAGPLSHYEFKVFFRASHDGGLTFENTIILEPSHSQFPRIATSGDAVYAVWSGPGSDIWFAVSLDRGRTFGTARNLSNSVNGATSPEIAASGSGVFVIWSERDDDPFHDVFFTASSDWGSTFSAPINLSDTPYSSSEAQILASEGNVYVIWSNAQDSDVFLRHSSDNGNTFGQPLNLSSDSASSGEPSISSSGDNVYVTWGNLEGEVYLRRSTNGGTTFSDRIRLNDGLNEKEPLHHSQVTVCGYRVYTAWEDSTLDLRGVMGVFFRMSTDNGDTFSSTLTVSNSSYFSINPRLACSKDAVHVNWSEKMPTGKVETFLISSFDGGNSFTERISLNADSAGDNSPSTALVPSDDGLFLAWQGMSDGELDVFFRPVFLIEDRPRAPQSGLNIPLTTYLALTGIVAVLAISTYLLVRRKYPTKATMPEAV